MRAFVSNVVFIRCDPPAPRVGGGGGGGQPGYGAPQIQQSLNVSNEVVGAIIGRAGSKINEIRQTSGAQVKIADKVPGAVERTIIMSGTPEAVQMAQYVPLALACSDGFLFFFALLFSQPRWCRPAHHFLHYLAASASPNLSPSLPTHPRPRAGT